MKILFAGKFDPDYNRTKIILDGLKYFEQAEVQHYNFNTRSRFNLPQLAAACKQADVIFLPSFTHRDVPLIKAVTRKPVIFDPLISRYLTKVFDYQKVKRHSPRAFKNFMKDKLSMNRADIVLCDTHAHKNYFHSTIGIRDSKLKILPVGVNTDECYPLPPKENRVFTVGFYGSFIPLHGTSLIIEAARLLKDRPVHFKMIGSGFEYEKIKALALNKYQLSNINFTGWVNYAELMSCINSFDIALGIFGDSQKADLVIPNKIFHYAALKKAIITKNTPAIREIFRDGQNILLSDNTPHKLAEKILYLLDHPSFRDSIAQAGHLLVSRNYNHKKTAARFLEIASGLLARKEG